MIVAWQFIARNRAQRRYVPLGYGVILYRELINVSKNAVDPSNHTVPNGTGPLNDSIPGNKLPGYRSVSPYGTPNAKRQTPNAKRMRFHLLLLIFAHLGEPIVG